MSASTFAIPLALLTTTAFNVGLIVEKRALGNMPPLQLNKAARTLFILLSTPAWLAGLSLMLTGLALQVIVLAIEPISVVQPILASGVALTLVLSRLILREKLGGGENWCVAIMAGSLVLLALSQDAASNQVTRGADPLAVVGVVAPALALGVLAASWPWRHGGGRGRPAGTAMLAGLGVGLLYGVSALASKGLSSVVGASVVGSSVVGGGHARTHLVIGLLSSPYLYLLFACSAIAMLLYQTALQACRASVLIPVSNVVSSGFFVIVGTWLFHEQLPASPVKLGLRLAGIAAAGVVLVILGIQSRGAEVADAETELAGLEIPESARAMAGRTTGSQSAGSQSAGSQSAGSQSAGSQSAGSQSAPLRRTGPQPVLDRITGPQPLAVLRRTGPQLVAARVTGPQLVGAPVAGPAPMLSTDPADDPEPGWPIGSQPIGSQAIGSQAIGSQAARLTGPQPATVRSTGSVEQLRAPAMVSLSPDIRLTDSPTWRQAAGSLLRGGRPRGKHEKSRTGKTGALSPD